MDECEGGVDIDEQLSLLYNALCVCNAICKPHFFPFSKCLLFPMSIPNTHPPHTNSGINDHDEVIQSNRQMTLSTTSRTTLSMTSSTKSSMTSSTLSPMTSSTKSSMTSSTKSTMTSSFFYRGVPPPPVLRCSPTRGDHRFATPGFGP